MSHDGTPDWAPGATDWVARGVHLLDAEPDFADGLDSAEREQVRRHLVVPTVTLEPGPWDITGLGDAHGVRGDVHGFLVLSGAVTMGVEITGRSCLRLLVPGELVLLDGREVDSIPTSWGWSVIEHSQLAVLDERLLVIGRRWPGVMASILKRGAQQTRHALLQQAISQLPRVEHRLLALLWTVADRRGVVRADGVWVALPVRQETLAQMIGARRPTVSLGLKRLTDDGLITPEEGGWLLSPASVDAFSEIEPAAKSGR